VSHFTQVETKINDLVALQAALAERLLQGPGDLFTGGAGHAEHLDRHFPVGKDGDLHLLLVRHRV
jgi:hypothetical protein